MKKDESFLRAQKRDSPTWVFYTTVLADSPTTVSSDLKKLSLYLGRESVSPPRHTAPHKRIYAGIEWMHLRASTEIPPRCRGYTRAISSPITSLLF